MPARLRIRLSEIENEKLLELSRRPSLPERTRKRAEVLCLNNKGWTVNQIASWIKWAPNTVRNTIGRWLMKGEESLWDKPRSGRKKSWTEADIEYIESKCDKEERTYNSKQLSEILKKERKIEIKAARIRQILKKRAENGSEPKLVLDCTQNPEKKRRKKPI